MAWAALALAACVEERDYPPFQARCLEHWQCPPPAACVEGICTTDRPRPEAEPQQPAPRWVDPRAVRQGAQGKIKRVRLPRATLRQQAPNPKPEGVPLLTDDQEADSR